MKHEKIIAFGLLFASFYIAFWLWFFSPSASPKKIAIVPKSQSVFKFTDSNLVLGAKVNPEPSLPASYKISIDSRRQYFNLSCEFAAAAGIIFHFTNNSDFEVNNQAEAEKELLQKVWISKNPNVGIRMGIGGEAGWGDLYANLNSRFGGADYYGIHAPPFIDLFAGYGLTAKPIYINDLTISSIRQAIFNGHLIMAWIKIGYASPIDDDLSYGKVKIIRGEHAVIINGFDGSGVEIMDPGIGLQRHVDYGSLINASSFFPIPFLEVYRNTDNQKSLVNLTVGFDTLTGIDRSIPRIRVENGAGQTGAAYQMRDILRDFGYKVISVGNANSFDYQDVSVRVKKDFSDFSYILDRDIRLAEYIVASSSADLSWDSEVDIVVIVGR
jgi:hypothetical protein